MKRKIIFFILLLTLFLTFSFGKRNEKFKYGVKFGLLWNDFSALSDGANNPFLSDKITSKTGLIGGVFYDYFLKRNLAVTFGLNYKLLVLKGTYVTDTETPILGDFKNYFHCIDIPMGVKLYNMNMNGRPYIGGGLEYERIVGDDKTFSISGEGDMDYVESLNTIPGYNSKSNLGPYMSFGFEIPGINYNYILEFKYVRWMQDTFEGDLTFYERSKNEFRILFGLKIK